VLFVNIPSASLLTEARTNEAAVNTDVIRRLYEEVYSEGNVDLIG